MEIKFNGKTIKLSFGLKFLNIIDKEWAWKQNKLTLVKVQKC